MDMTKLPVRILDKIAFEPMTGCWLWTAAATRGGYGVIMYPDRLWLAHRKVYEIMRGKMPAGTECDHLCRTPACVNPDHIEPVTHTVNMHRGNGWSGRKHRQTHCFSGHEFTPENTIITYLGRRVCRACKSRWDKEYKARVKWRKRQKGTVVE